MERVDMVGAHEVAEDLEETGRFVVGGGVELPEPAHDVLQVEGAAAPTSAEGHPSMQEAWLYRENVKPSQIDLSEVNGVVQHDENFVWIELSRYAEDELAHLAQELRLDAPAVKSAISRWQRPRLQIAHDHFFASATVARASTENLSLEASELDLFVGRNYLVSAHKLPLPFYDQIFQRSRHNPELVRLDSAFMLYLILDELLEHYEGLLEQVIIETEKAEERALQDTSEDMLPQLLRLKRFAFTLSQLVDQHRGVFDAFLRPDFPFVSGDEVLVYFRDLQGRLSHLHEALAAARDSITGAFDIYVSHVAHRTNNVMKVLTVVSVTLLPSTVILGFFGTQFTSVSFLYSAPSFVVMVAAILLVTLVVLFLLQRQDWL